MTKTELKNWKFSKSNIQGLSFPAKETERVSLPHTWNALDGQNGGNNFYRGRCWYHMNLNMTKLEDKKYFIEFEAANSVAEVFINKRSAGTHEGGYSAFRFEIGSLLLNEGDNEILVSVDNSHREDIYPLVADFTFMGGLYRKAWLIEADQLHFDLMDHGSQGLYVKQVSLTPHKAELELRALICSVPEIKNAKLLCRVLDAEGSIVTRVESIISGEDEINLKMAIDNPQYWEGRENPYLYSLEAELQWDGKTVDTRIIPTGLRSISIDSEKGFILNGKTLKLNGVSRHQDRKDIGWALSEKEHDEDLKLIQEIGANSIRLAHYQHSDYFYEICDRSGMITWAEIPYITNTSSEDTTGRNAISQMTELVKQNFNHPSICIWGVQNEITIAGKVDNIENIVIELNSLVKKLDPSRVTAQAQVGHHPDDDSMNSITDCVGYNKYFGWYYNDAEDFAPWLENFHKRFPSIPLGITEYGCEGILDYHNSNPQKNDYSEEYQTLYHEKVLSIFDRYSWLWGTYVWNMFDFASDFRDEGGVKGMNNKGLMTHDRKTRKDSFYWYKANWNPAPMVHITAKRYINRTGRKTEIKVYSNAAEVSLEIDGKKILKAPVVNHIALFEKVVLKRRKTIITATAGKCRDRIILKRVRKEDPAYICKADTKNPMGEGFNWFDEDYTNMEVPSLTFPVGYLSIKDRVRDILKNEEGEKVLRKYMEPLFDHPAFNMVKSFSIEKMAEMKEDMFPPAFIAKVNEALTKVKKE